MNDSDKGSPETGESSKYTHEVKVVTAVWVHEKEFNNQTWKDINRNFLARFGLPPPSRSTLMNWERKLFETGSVEDKEKSGRPLSRLMHVPYVRQSLQESPELSIRERSKLLGLPRTTLLKIIREDLNMEYEVEPDNSYLHSSNKRHAPSGGGKWVKRVSLESVAGSLPKKQEVSDGEGYCDDVDPVDHIDPTEFLAKQEEEDSGNEYGT